MADRQRDEAVDAVGHERGHGPRESRTPVVPDDVGALHAERVEDAEHVADDVEYAVLARPLPASTTRRSHADRGDDAVAGVDAAPAPDCATARASRGSRAAARRPDLRLRPAPTNVRSPSVMFFMSIVPSSGSGADEREQLGAVGPGRGVGSARATARSAKPGRASTLARDRAARPRRCSRGADQDPCMIELASALPMTQPGSSVSYGRPSIAASISARR